MPNAPYDVETEIGQVRFWIGNTTTADATAEFTDAELTYCLSVAPGNPILAAAFALRALASNAARVAQMVKTGPITTDARELSAALRAAADSLTEQSTILVTSAQALPEGGAPDQVFSTDSNAGETIGTMTDW